MIMEHHGPTEEPFPLNLRFALLRNSSIMQIPPGKPIFQQFYNTYFPPSVINDHSRNETVPLFGGFATPCPLGFRCDVSSSSSVNRKGRSEKKSIPDEQKDEKYYERRKRNNQAAKKSRDARKMREDQIALKATLLEHENAILRAQLLTMREETQSLRSLLMSSRKQGDDRPGEADSTNIH